MSFQDKTLNCVDCGQTFVFTAGEQEFYAQKGFQNAPKRCKACKATKRSSGPGGGMDAGGSRELFEVVCSSCGQKTTVPFKPTADRPFGDLSHVELIEQMGDWSRSYADTVYRTNVATAYSAGRMRQLADPEVADVVRGLRYTAVGDSDTRPSHKAMDGFTAPADDPVWHRVAPPAGYNCRCDIEIVTIFDQRMKVVPGGSKKIPSDFPDHGFGHGRPDFVHYGGTI